MKLNQLMLCLDCDEVSLTATLCPLCASRGVVELATWIKSYDTLTPRSREHSQTPDNPGDDIQARRAALFAECKNMAKKIETMTAEIDQGAEPLGCGA